MSDGWKPQAALYVSQSPTFHYLQLTIQGLLTEQLALQEAALRRDLPGHLDALCERVHRHGADLDLVAFCGPAPLTITTIGIKDYGLMEQIEDTLFNVAAGYLLNRNWHVQRSLPRFLKESTILL